MNKPIIQNTQLTVSRVIQGKNEPNDKSGYHEDCSTQNSDERLSLGDISILEESSSTIQSEFQYNFKKSKLTERSQLRESTVSSIDNQGRAGGKKGFVSFHKDIAQLEAIERKTEQLAIREKQQRKQLKKLRRLLSQHQEQLKTKQFGFQVEKTQLSNKIDELHQREAGLVLQKNQIQKKLKELALQLHQTKQQASKFTTQKERLLRHLQYLEANLDDSSQNIAAKQHQPRKNGSRLEQMVQDITELDEAEKEIQIVDAQIARLKLNAQTQDDYKKLLDFYELKNKYAEKRQELRLQKSNRRFTNIIFKLNKVILNRNQEIDSYFQKKEEVQPDHEEKNLTQTSDSFFGVSQRDENLKKNAILQAKHITEQKTKQILQKVTILIESNTIKEYEQIYENIDKIALTLLTLRATPENEEKCLEQIQRDLVGINNCITSKAQRNYEKIRRLMAIVEGQSARNTQQLTEKLSN